MRVQTRRTDAFPTTWEIPVGIAVTSVLASALGLPLGQGVAYLVVQHHFVWPGERLGVSLLGLLAGEPGRGLPDAITQDLPPIGLVYLGVTVVELALAAVAGVALASWWRTVGPLAQFGLASRHEVDAVLGRRALMRRRRTIRPDLPRRRWRNPG